MLVLSSTVLGIPLEAAADVADHLHLVLHSQVQLFENLFLLPNSCSSCLVIKTMLEHSRFEAFDPHIVQPHWDELLPSLFVLADDEVIQLPCLEVPVVEGGCRDPLSNLRVNKVRARAWR